MSVYFLGCAHLGHNNIAKFRPFVSSKESNIRLIWEDWNKRIGKNDVIYCMGDTAFDQQSLDLIGNAKGRKILIKGNHDDLVSTHAQSQVFEEIYGILKYKGMWLTHCPIHPDEMRNRKGNIHAHVHNETIMKKTWYGKKVPDPRYFNTCVDVIWPKYGSAFISLEEVRKYFTI